MTKYTVKLIGVNEYKDEQPLLIDLQAVSGVVSVDLECSSVNIAPEMTTETKEYKGGLTVSVNDIRISDELVLDYKLLPLSSTTFLNYFQFIGAMLKKYTYIYSSEYNIELASLAGAGKALRVNFTGMNIEVEANGLIKYGNLPFVSGVKL